MLDAFDGADGDARRACAELVGCAITAAVARASTSSQQILHALRGDERRRAHVRFDPSLARGLSYYTGAIMEIAVPDLAGSLGGGGRYDNLIGMFLGEEVPACGFSLGLERILVVMARAQHVSAGGRAGVRPTCW